MIPQFMRVHESKQGGCVRQHLVTISGQYGNHTGTGQHAWEVAYPAHSTDVASRHNNNNVIFTAFKQASDGPIGRALDIGFIGPWFKPGDGQLFSIPVLLATADRMGVSGLDLCQHFSVR